MVYLGNEKYMGSWSWLIKSLSLIIIAVFFYDAILLLMLPSTANLILATDGSIPSFVTCLSALAIGMMGLNNGFKAMPNYWALLLIFFVVFSSFHSPNITFDSTFLPHNSAIFNYKPMFECLIFLLMFMGIYSMELNNKTFNKTIQTLSWIAVIYAGYIIFQRLGMDQLYRLSHDQRIGEMTRNPECGGFISQPVFASAMLAIILPLIWQYGRIWQFALCLLAIIVTGNRSALLTSVVCFLYNQESLRKYGKILLGGYIAYLILGVLLQYIPHSFHWKIFLEERFDVWNQIIQDFIHPMFPGAHTSYLLTGTGIGSFSVFFPFYHHSGYFQAHNEFLETLKCLGIVGLFLLFKSIGCLPNANKAISASILASCILAMTNPIWHIPQLQFLTILLIGLAYNKEQNNVLGTINTA